MDGITINAAQNTQGILTGGQTTKEINRIDQPQIPNLGVESTEKSFATTLKDAVGQVNQAQKESDFKMQELATGKSQNIHETMIAAEKVETALRLMVQVRNKMIEAYQEMMRMQV